MTRRTFRHRHSAAVLVLLGLFVVLLLATAAAAVAGDGSPSPAASDASVTFKVGLTQDYDGFSPFNSWSGPSWESFRLGYNFLTWYDQDYKPVPDLAESWETSPDGKAWTFTIREGMKWHDGEPLTAADIAFTYNLILDTEHWAYIQYLTGVTSVTAPDATTLVIETRKPNAGMLALYIPILPEHIWRDVDPEGLEDYKNIPFVGSGPFKMVEAKKSKWIRLAANPDYPEELGGPPKIDEVYFIISQNTDSMVQDYKAGSLDAIVEWPALNYSILESVPGSTVVASPAIGFHELAFNCWDSPKSKGNPLLRDVAIRQAVHWAIDKEKLNQFSMGGRATPATSLISTVQGDWHWDVPEAEQYTYDPEKAKQILEDAGYTDADGDGVRENAKGDKLQFRFVTLNEYPEDQAAGKLIVAWCGDVGIKLDLEQQDEGAFGDEVYDNADCDMFIWNWRGDIDPGFMLSTFTTEQILNWGDSQYSNPEYDALYVKQAEALNPEDPTDPAPRKAVTDEMQRILYQDNPYILLWYNVNLQAFRTDRWTGYATVPRENGAPLFNLTRTTYQELEPVTAATTSVDEGGSTAWIWIVAAVVGAVIVVLILQRRRRKTETE